MNAGERFTQSYTALPARAWAMAKPTPAPDPRWLAWNERLAQELGLEDLHSPEGLKLFSGNSGDDLLAMAYAGHQFGHFVPQLGDGRALLLGEAGGREVQLKGAGRTVFSRGGDGRAWLGPVLREYLMSEAMHGLGIPTTRALAAIATGETVLRETALPGAILTRVAASHLRVGSFEYFAARQDAETVQALCDFAISRHYPSASGPEELLASVVTAQAQLVAGWMSVGFIHGVMNTDNCAISGETIDYGPAAMMDEYNPAQVYSQIDHTARYAYGNQPKIAHWNLAQLANALLIIMPDEQKAVAQFTDILDGFAPEFASHWQRLFSAKIGLHNAPTGLIEELLDLMAQHQLDFTNSFASLAENPPPALLGWVRKWRALDPDPAIMATSNPRVVPRLHLISGVIDAAGGGNMAPFAELFQACTHPFTPRERDDPLTLPPSPEQRVSHTTCGT